MKQIKTLNIPWKELSPEDDLYSKSFSHDARYFVITLPSGMEISFVRYTDEDLSSDELKELNIFIDQNFFIAIQLKHASDKEANKAVNTFISILKDIGNEVKTILSEYAYV